MSEELDRLWRLHELDERVAEVRAALRKLPDQKRALETRAAAERARLESHRRAAAEVQSARRKLEQEIETVTATQRQFESQQPSVKTNEAYTALLHEIAQCKAKRSDLETGVLLRFEEEEKLAAERPALERALKEAEAELATRRVEIERAEAAEREKLAALDAERAGEMLALPPATRQRYERVHGSKEGRAVVPIVKNACGGCFRAQPPQAMQEAKKRERFLTCDGCGRLLVYPPDAA